MKLKNIRLLLSSKARDEALDVMYSLTEQHNQNGMYYIDGIKVRISNNKYFEINCRTSGNYYPDFTKSYRIKLIHKILYGGIENYIDRIYRKTRRCLIKKNYELIKFRLIEDKYNKK